MAQVSVKIGKMPGRIKPVFLDTPATVETALKASQLDSSGYEVRVNGTKSTNMNTTLKEGDTVLLVKQIKGNR